MFTVRVERMPGLELGPGLREHADINKSTGAVIVEEWRENLLLKFHLQQNGSYKEEWRRQHPKNVKRDCPKYLTDTGYVILQNVEKGTTFVFDQEMKVIDSWQHQGRLIATLPGTRTVYAVREGEKWHVEIRIKGGEVLQLKPDESTWECSNLNVCECARTGKLAVMYTGPRTYQNRRVTYFGITDTGSTSSLDIFSRDGKTKQKYSMTHFMSISAFVFEFRLQEIPSF